MTNAAPCIIVGQIYHLIEIDSETSMSAFGAIQSSLRASATMNQRDDENSYQTSQDIPVCKTTTTITKTTYVHYEFQTRNEIFHSEPGALASVTSGLQGEKALKGPMPTEHPKSGVASRSFMAGIAEYLGKGLKQSDADAAQFLSVVTHN